MNLGGFSSYKPWGLKVSLLLLLLFWTKNSIMYFKFILN